MTMELVCQNWYLKASEPEKKFGLLWVELYSKIDLYAEAEVIPGKNFRFDFVHYPSKVAIEVQGFGPGHYSIKGVARDNEKQRAAAEHGWLVLPLESDKVEDAEQHHRIAKIIEGRMNVNEQKD